MRRRAFLTTVAGVACLLLDAPSRARPQAPLMGAPLRVRLFAGERITRLQVGDTVLDAASRTISTGGSNKALGSDVAELTGSPHLDVTATTALGASIKRRYSGSLFVQLRIDVFAIINQVAVEPYVASVLSAEVSPGWSTESLRAQAIAIRTYAERARVASGAREHDLNDDTSSQVYRGMEKEAPSLVNAAQDTSGKIVVYGNSPAAVFYSSSCGGHTAASVELTGRDSPEYLIGIPDVDAGGHAYCGASPYFRWKNAVSAASIARVVDVPREQVSSLSVSERWPDGRAKTIAITTSGDRRTLTGRTFYSRVMALLGYKVIPSALFDIVREGDNFVFSGHGVGHGVGLCQWGARGRADAGASAQQILAAYFPGTAIM